MDSHSKATGGASRFVDSHRKTSAPTLYKAILDQSPVASQSVGGGKVQGRGKELLTITIEIGNGR